MEATELAEATGQVSDDGHRTDCPEGSDGNEEIESRLHEDGHLVAAANSVFLEDGSGDRSFRCEGRPRVLVIADAEDDRSIVDMVFDGVVDRTTGRAILAHDGSFDGGRLSQPRCDRSRKRSVEWSEMTAVGDSLHRGVGESSMKIGEEAIVEHGVTAAEDEVGDRQVWRCPHRDCPTPVVGGQGQRPISDGAAEGDEFVDSIGVAARTVAFGEPHTGLINGNDPPRRGQLLEEATPEVGPRGVPVYAHERCSGLWLDAGVEDVPSDGASI